MLSEIIHKLKTSYPNASCELEYSSEFELLVAVILSAQCTDKRVNEVTKTLFKTANTPEEFAAMDTVMLEKLIYSCGFYRSKAKSIISASKDLVNKFSGQVPDSLEALISLQGVGRKTANVVLSECFRQDAIAVDTHVFRVSRRLGFSGGTSPEAVENDLIKIFGNNNLVDFNGDKVKLGDIHHLLIFHGRYCCHSQRPKCTECPITEYCKEVKKCL